MGRRRKRQGTAPPDKPAAKRPKQPSPHLAKALAFLSDPTSVDAWVNSIDLYDILNNSDGLVRIDDVFPDDVAEGLLDMVKTLPKDRWSVRKDVDNVSSNTTQHHFLVANPLRLCEHGRLASGRDGLTLVARAIQKLMPEKRSYFTAARYATGHHITDHDDHAHVHHEREDGSDDKPVFCSRDVAFIYYLTKDWKESDGGILVDLQTGNRYTPKFNSAVAFLVPRFHEVTAVSAPRQGRDDRFSVFGWFLEPGDLYTYKKEEDVTQEAPKPKKQANKRKKRKKRNK